MTKPSKTFAALDLGGQASSGHGVAHIGTMAFGHGMAYCSCGCHLRKPAPRRIIPKPKPKPAAPATPTSPEVGEVGPWDPVYFMASGGALWAACQFLKNITYHDDGSHRYEWEHTRKVEKAETMLWDAELEIIELKKLIEKLRKEKGGNIDALEAELASLRRQLAERDRELKETRARLQDETAAHAETSAQLVAVLGENARLKDLLASRDSELAGLRGVISALEAQLAALRAENERLRQSLSASNLERDRLARELKIEAGARRSAEDRAAALQRELDAARARIAELEALLARRENELAGTKAAMASLEKDFGNLRIEFVNLQDTHRRCGQDNGRIAELERLIAIKTKDCNHHILNVEQARDQTADVGRRANALLAKLASRGAAFAALAKGPAGAANGSPKHILCICGNPLHTAVLDGAEVPLVVASPSYGGVATVGASVSSPSYGSIGVVPTKDSPIHSSLTGVH